ncbi:hypothetical protein [Sphingopyxis yananensis]|uniref:hypothetical protein n=1 Tax=Sphingopyxis yananensis TaxID=2886687 RepID=UPI001D119ACE|nr:hypothetical protein [Sphingopyxis yananensis]MCC2601538.1 hypothetical protein [Sphingopyxis yananensis]
MGRVIRKAGVLGALMVAGLAAWTVPLAVQAQEKGGGDGAGAFLEDAAAACRHGDFSTFLFSFSADDVVQQRYSAAVISFASIDDRTPRPVRLERYLDLASFPLRPMDTQFYTRPSVDTMRGHFGTHKDLVPVDFTVDESVPSRRTVNWVWGRFVDTPEEDEGMGYAFEKISAGGTLIFRAKDGCWQLEGDIRH